MDRHPVRDQATIAELPAPAPTPSVTRSTPTRNPVQLAGAVAAAWLVAGLATAVHLDWVLLPLLVAAVASVLRTGRNVVDRLMLSTFVVAAGLVAGGLLFSLWPWGLDPLPVAGTSFTVVAIAAWLGRRRPQLPRGFSISDLMILGTGVFVFLLEVRPILGRSYIDRFSVNSTAEDRAAHFALFDTIHRLGSYPFLDQVAARVSLQTPTEADYPAATHFLYAVIDIFVRSTTSPGPTIAALNRYFVLVLVGYAFLLTSMVWAARWIIAPFVRGWRLFAATATVAATLIGWELMALVGSGFDSQVLGLAFVVMTMAFAVRPPLAVGERILALGAGIVLVSYTYYLYLPFAVIPVLASLWFHRRVLRRAWRTLAVAALCIGAVAVVPVYFAATSKLDVAAQVLAGGAVYRPARSMTIGLTVASLAVLVTAAGRRYRSFMTIGLSLSVSFVLTVLFGLYQRFSLGKTSYYFEKLLTAQLVVAVVCAVTLVMFLNPLAAADRDSRTARIREIGLGAVATVIAFTAIAGFGFGIKTFGQRGGEWSQSALGKWSSGKWDQGYRGRAATNELKSFARQGLLADGTTTIFLVTNSSYTNWRITFTNATLNRTNGATMELVNSVQQMPVGGLPASVTDPVTSNADKHLTDQQKLDRAIVALEKALAHNPTPVRIVVANPDVADAIRSAVEDNPSLRATVVPAPKQ